MFENIGYCGINGQYCIIYKAAKDPKIAEELSKEWKKMG
jgi:hypothetical protein